ncbi:sensor histidine kinase [Streptomyces zagrosensis]|uniref:histidine kinase n=1 Tax=Streptomyces zagrosensis TaxID=1042984 RepID=A0A7W9UWK9_9ACTN|nr:histidine kinase [Streptomyces zagrosensis]MBB5933391.1 signal transduction histidine kinase [Streptomyces zagrosensis]
MPITSAIPRPSRPALPQRVPTPQRIWRRARPVAAAALAWCGAVVYPFALFSAAQAGPYRSASLRFTLTAAATVLPVWLLRRRPMAALVLMLIGTFAGATPQGPPWEQGVPWEVSYLLVLVDDAVVGYIAATRSRRTGLAAAALTLIVQIAVATSRTSATDSFTNTVLLCLVALVAAWTAGRALQERREHAAALRTQAAAQAVTAERLRIARELHDMIAHSMGIIAIQAGVGSRVIDTQPAEARTALTVIEATSRETLAGLRRTLGALRRTEPTAGYGSGRGGGAGAPHEPAPGLDDLGRLAAATADAGVRVEVRWRGERRPLPADIDLACYRIVQEALTNVVRHAGTSACRVTVAYQEAELLIQIDDEGRASTTAPGERFGIVGMRERVGLLRGQFTAGPRPEGGFRVAALLPVPVSVPVGTATGKHVGADVNVGADADVDGAVAGNAGADADANADVRRVGTSLSTGTSTSAGTRTGLGARRGDR